MREGGAGALQRFAEDFMPLILLFAVSLTGLMLTASYTWMKGYGFTFISILHAITVIGTCVWLPFGKFFHIFQRPAQLGVGLYKDIRRASFVMAQGLMWRRARGGAPLVAGAGLQPRPTYVNGGRGEGPLDTEDAENFHP
ncbi:MAG: transporter [Polyangiaceae bacterium]|nr:transporter [Polyangiaceae bacterium]